MCVSSEQMLTFYYLSTVSTFIPLLTCCHSLLKSVSQPSYHWPALKPNTVLMQIQTKTEQQFSKPAITMSLLLSVLPVFLQTQARKPSPPLCLPPIFTSIKNSGGTPDTGIFFWQIKVAVNIQSSCKHAIGLDKHKDRFK